MKKMNRHQTRNDPPTTTAASIGSVVLGGASYLTRRPRVCARPASRCWRACNREVSAVNTAVSGPNRALPGVSRPTPFPMRTHTLESGFFKNLDSTTQNP